MRTDRKIGGRGAAGSILGLLALSALGQTAGGQTYELASPEGRVRATISRGEDGRLMLRVRRGETPVLLDSPLGVRVDGVDYGADARPGTPEGEVVELAFPWRGHASRVEYRAHAYRVPVESGAAGEEAADASEEGGL